MSDVWWIKLATAMFDDEKIKLIETLPDGDSLLVIWVKLLCQAGKVNSNGYIFLTKDIPFTDDNLVTLFRKPISTIRLALATFEHFQMITIDPKGIIYLPNWSKYQNLKGLDDIREQTRIRVQKHRSLTTGNVTGNVTVALSNVTVTNPPPDKEMISEDATLYRAPVPYPPPKSKKKEPEPEKEIEGGMGETAVADVFKTFEENYQKLSQRTTDAINDMIDTYGLENVIYALNEGIKHNARNIAYVTAILENQDSKGKGSERILPQSKFNNQKFGNIVQK